MGNPWRAFLPYDEDSALQFKGRDNNIQELFSVLQSERTTVCYADSGVGKSSLINAGLKPLLRKHDYFPVDVVFTEADFALSNCDFDKLVIKCINNEILKWNESNEDVHYEIEEIFDRIDFNRNDLDKEFAECSLWWWLHTRKISCSIKGYKISEQGYSPIFIFDQFEELFTQSRNEDFISSFFKWFAEATSDGVPDEIIKLINLNCDYISLEGLPDDIGAKFLVSLRQDSIGTLDYWVGQRYAIPSLHRNRYCLLPLTVEQARLVITEQNTDILNTVADDIIGELIDDSTNSVAAIMLSVFCNRLYENAKTDSDGNKLSVNKEDVSANKETLIKQYYEDLLKKTGISDEIINIIEDCLVSETGKRNRIVNDSNEKLNDIGFDKNYRKILSGCYLINDRGDYIEIAHDKVAEAIFARKKDRKLKKNLRFWRILSFFLPFFLLVFSLLYLIVPSDIQQNARHEYVLDDDEFFRISSVLDYDFGQNNSWVENVLVDSFNRVVFDGCNNLRKAKVTTKKTYVEFKNCPNLEYIELADSVTDIGADFIVNCPKLKKIYIPSSVNYINTDAFVSKDLVVEIDSANENFVWDDGVLWDKKHSNPVVFVQEQILDITNRIPFIEYYSYIENLSNENTIKYRGVELYPINQYNAEIFVSEDSTKLLPSITYKFYKTIDLSKFDKIKEIPEKLFKNCTRLENVKLPSSLTSVGDEAFYGCKNLEGITFPESLSYIGEYAFRECIGLKNISFLGDSMSIGDYAFSYCISLDSLVLPKQYFSSKHYGFAYCTNLKKVYIPQNDIVLSGYPDELSGNLFELSGNLFEGCENLECFEYADSVHSKLRIKDGLVFKDNCFLFGSNRYINYADAEYYSENGFLYDRATSKIVACNTKSQFDKILKWNFIKIDLKVGTVNLRLYKELYKERIVLPMVNIGSRINCCTWQFLKLPENLKDLHILNPQPDYITHNYSYVTHDYGDKYRRNKLRIELPLYIRKNITLHVPYGCSKYYINHPDFQGYKNIVEDSLWQRIYGVIESFLDGIIGFFSSFWWSLPLCILGLLTMCGFIYLLDRIINKNAKSISRSKKTLWGAVAYALFITPISFMGGYWFVFIVLDWSQLISTIIGVVFCVITAMLLSIMQITTFKDLWKIRHEILGELKKYIIVLWKKLYLTKVLLCISVLGVAYWGYQKYTNKLQVYRAETQDKFYSLIKNEGKEKAYSYLYSRLSSRSMGKMDYTLISILNAHDNATTSCCFSPDGKYILTASDDNTAMLWDAFTCEVVDTLKGHYSGVRSAIFSPDGKYILTASWDYTAMLWDASTCEVVDTLKGHDGSVTSAVFSPDGKYILTASIDDTAMLWDASTCEVVDTLKGHGSNVNSAIFSPDGKYILTASIDDTAMLWDASTCEVVDTLKGHGSNVNSAVFSPDGKYILTASIDATAMLWDASTCEVVDTLKGHDYGVNSAVFSPDGKYILTASADNTAMLWDFNLIVNPDKHYAYAKEMSIKCPLSDEELAGFGFNYDKWAQMLFFTMLILVVVLCFFIVKFDVIAVLYRINNNLSRKQKKYVLLLFLSVVVLLGLYRMIGWYNKMQNDYIEKIVSDAKKYYDDHYNVKAVCLLIEGLSEKQIYNDSIAKRILDDFSITLRHDDNLNSAVFSPDGKYILTASADDTAMLWDASTCEVVDTLKGHVYGVNSAIFRPDGKYILTASADDTAMLWDASTCEVVDTLKGHEYNVNSAVFSPDDKYILTTSDDDTAMLWDTSTCEVVDTLMGHKHGVTSAVFSPDAKYILTASWDDTAMLWDASTCEVVDTLKGHEYAVNSAVFSSDGKYILTASRDKSAMLWDASTCEVIDTFKGHDASVTSAAFSPDGKFILTASLDNTAMLWNASTCEVIDTIKGHLYDVNSAVFSPDGKYILTASNDNTAKLWDIESLSDYKKKYNYILKCMKKYGWTLEETDVKQMKWWFKF